MKKSFLILLSFILFFVLNCSNSPQTAVVKPQNEPVQSRADRLNAFLGDMMQVISNPDSVESYKVKIKQAAALPNTINGYPIEKKGANLNAEQIALLKSILLSESTYDFERVKKNFILPEFAFIIKKGNQTVTLLIDYYRNELLFRYGNIEKKEDFDNARDKMLKITQALFAR